MGQSTGNIQLCLLEGPQAGLIIEGSSSSSMRIGRTKASKLQVKDPSVSEKHGEVVFSEGKWLIRDLGSSNGTLLNGEPVEEEYKELRNGDKLKLGTDSVAVVKIIQCPPPQQTVQQFIEAECGQLEELIRGQAEQLAKNLQTDWLEKKGDLYACAT